MADTRINDPRRMRLVVEWPQDWPPETEEMRRLNKEWLKMVRDSVGVNNLEHFETVSAPIEGHMDDKAMNVEVLVTPLRPIKPYTDEFELEDLESLADSPPDLPSEIAVKVMELPWVNALIKDGSEAEVEAMCYRYGDIQNVVNEVLKQRGIKDV